MTCVPHLTAGVMLLIAGWPLSFLVGMLVQAERHRDAVAPEPDP